MLQCGSSVSRLLITPKKNCPKFFEAYLEVIVLQNPDDASVQTAGVLHLTHGLAVPYLKDVMQWFVSCIRRCSDKL